MDTDLSPEQQLIVMCQLMGLKLDILTKSDPWDRTPTGELWDMANNQNRAKRYRITTTPDYRLVGATSERATYFNFDANRKMDQWHFFDCPARALWSLKQVNLTNQTK